MDLSIKFVSAIFFVLIIFLIFKVVKNLVEVITFSVDNGISKSRLKQFNKGVKKDDLSNFETVNSLTEMIRLRWFPKIQEIMPSLKIDKLEQLEKEIKFIGWDDTFTAESYIATNLGLKIFGLLIFGLLFLMGGELAIIGFVLMLAISFTLDIMFKSEVKSKNELLFADFPELIRITAGYLIEGMDLVRAMEHSAKYVSDEWKPILHDFVINANTNGVTKALDILKNTVDMFEVKEFVSLVRLTLEQGGDAKESFLSQAKKISELQKAQFKIKIGKRKTMGLLVQAPMLLVNIAVIAIPILINALSIL